MCSWITVAHSKVLILLTFLVYKIAATGSINIEPEDDIHLTVPETINRYGYPVEVHRVRTPDGYILQLHRIRNTSRSSQLPVILMHGFEGSSSHFTVAGPGKALAYLLADQGTDVWIANARGNMYSRNHTHLNPDTDPAFWRFCFNEIGIIDLPTVIDYILNVTGTRQVDYVGHSQGGTVYFVMLSELPQYEKKIRRTVLLAPAVAMTYQKSAHLALLYRYIDTYINIINDPTIHELVPHGPIMRRAIVNFCSASDINAELCCMAMDLISGRNRKQLDRKLVGLYLSVMVSGSSKRQGLHFFQMIKNGGYFMKYDFGTKINMKKYKQLEAPMYKMTNTTNPLIIFYGNNDALVDKVGVEKILSSYPNIKGYLIPDKEFGHMDLLWARDVANLVNKPLINILQQDEISLNLL